MTEYQLTLPAVRGLQAGRDCFVTMCPLKLLPSLFPDRGHDLRPELEIQRAVNSSRISEIARYVTSNSDSYVMPTITAAVDSRVQFEPSSAETSGVRVGTLHVPMSARFLIHDGLHRCAGLKAALKRKPQLIEETVAILIVVDVDFERSNQIYTDIKRHERKTARSLSILHDDRDEIARLVRKLIPKVPVFAPTTEMVRTTISNRSRKLFTLSAIYHATKTLLADQKKMPFDSKLALAVRFWTEAGKRIPDWQAGATGEISPAVLRREKVHCHGIALAALARAGHTLVKRYPKTWERRMAKIKTIDWTRSNKKLWEGRAMIGGRLSKAHSCVVLTGNVLKKHLGLALTEEEAELERQSGSGK